MKKLFLLFVGVLLAHWAMAQTVVVLNLPEPCAQNGVEDVIQTTFDFNVYPNPADKAVTLSFSDSDPIGKVEVLVSDMRGATVIRKQYFSSFSELRTEMQLDELAPGVYTISVRGKETHSVKKLVIK